MGPERRKQSCLKPSLRWPRKTKEITAARKRKGDCRDPHAGTAAGGGGAFQSARFTDANSPRPENHPRCPAIRSVTQSAEQQLPHESQKLLPEPPKRQSHQAQRDTGNELFHSQKSKRAETRRCSRHRGQRQSLLQVSLVQTSPISPHTAGSRSVCKWVVFKWAVQNSV